ncbi:GNAT family N-acetyltransferase [Burkholderia pyrrocinia]|nr:GNAT family N-acetyltransferase [Burkholderia pyrrocinia]
MTRPVEHSDDLALVPDINVNVRRGTAHDAPALADLFRSTYGDSTHPCQNPAYIRDAIAQQNDHWYIAQVADRIVGCLSVIHHTCNRATEFGYAAVDRDQHRTGIISTLLSIGLTNLQSRPAGLVFAVMRSTVAYKAFSKSVPSVLVGHDGGPNTAHGVREHHLTAIHPPLETRSFVHVSPRHMTYRRSRFIQEQLYAPLGLHHRPGPYPPQFFSGDASLIDLSAKGSRAEPTNAVGCCRRTALDTLSQDDVASDVRTFIAHNQSVGYLKQIVLADKIRLIRAMLQMGFDITAYLPAWHWHNGMRYDCVMLVKCTFNAPNRNGFDAEISAFDDAYRQIAIELLA